MKVELNDPEENVAASDGRVHTFNAGADFLPVDASHVHASYISTRLQQKVVIRHGIRVTCMGLDYPGKNA